MGAILDSLQIIMIYYSLLRQINDVQNVYCDYNVLKKVVPLLARTNQEISMEVLCLVDALLFNANKRVQVCGQNSSITLFYLCESRSISTGLFILILKNCIFKVLCPIIKFPVLSCRCFSTFKALVKRCSFSVSDINYRLRCMQ